jgi:formate dehydrogenase subunit gamma
MQHDLPASREPAPVPPLETGIRERIEKIIAPLVAVPGALLPILHGIQDAIGFVPPGSVALIADALNLSRAEVHGVISFYHEFRRSPPGRHVLKLCRAEACQAMGARELEARIRARFGIAPGETTADGALSLEPVYCLGNCACAPSALLDGVPQGRLTPQRIDALLDACADPA